MKKPTFAVLLLLFAVTSSFNIIAQQNSMKGRSTLELNLGLWHESRAGNEIGLLRIRSTAEASGFVGGLSYGHWLRENLSMIVALGVLSGEASSTLVVSGITQRTSSVIPILLGVKYYVPEPEAGASVRPFVSVAAGPYLGFEAKNTVLSQESRSETAFGAHLGAGIDFLLSRHLKLGTNLGYNLMTNYSVSIGARKNYSGPDFTLSFGFMFGRAAQ